MKPLIIYPSAAFGRRPEIRHYADQLTDRGFTICARWLTEVTESLEQAAMNDAEDEKSSDMVIIFADPCFFSTDETVPRGLLSAARMVELGMGLAWGSSYPHLSQ